MPTNRDGTPARPRYPCLDCIYHKQERTGTITDDEGVETPVIKHFCKGRRLATAELEFGCGLWRNQE